MTIEERHEALLDDIRKLKRRSETAKESYNRMLKMKPDSAYAQAGLDRENSNIVIYEKLLRDDWERQFLR